VRTPTPALEAAHRLEAEEGAGDAAGERGLALGPREGWGGLGLPPRPRAAGLTPEGAGAGR
jgi:hypothetical protein